ncbi:structural cement protein Gp24 [Sutterella wadsworthensis]|jgi:hypothetical protein|uniref:structural cement protein Gp24 n=1 Tax=Sutterella wadsworthensis TaxID=40545 RepID=UPI0013F66CDA|nr:hypothetical protein [Sutterella wadsworthensis]
MGFQAAVKTDPAIGIPGQEVNPRQAVYTAFNFVSDGTVPAGGFAFAVALNGTSQTEQNVLSAKAEAGAKLVGFVERDVIATIPAPTDDATQVYPKGTCPPVAIRGQFYAIATGAATEGQSVLCDPTTGKVTYGTAGATNDTGWTVVFPRGVKTIAEGDTVIYQNFGVDKAA